MGVGARAVLMSAHASASAFTTVFNPGLSGNTSGYQQCTVRQRLNAALWSPAINGSKIRITFQCATINALVMNDCHVGHRAASGNDWDFISAPTRVTFNSGGTGFTSISGGAIKVSDDVTFAFDSTKALIIAMDLGNAGATGSMRNISSYSDAEAYYIVDSDSAAVDPSGYSTDGPLGNLAGINLIEVLP